MGYFDGGAYIICCWVFVYDYHKIHGRMYGVGYHNLLVYHSNPLMLGSILKI